MTKTTNSRRPRRMAREPFVAAPQADGSKQAVPTECDNADRSAELASKTPLKASQVLDMLRRPNGATLSELSEATGWLPHTTRAALTGLRKEGHAITREKVHGTTHYTVAAVAGE